MTPFVKNYEAQLSSLFFFIKIGFTLAYGNKRDRYFWKKTSYMYVIRIRHGRNSCSPAAVKLQCPMVGLINEPMTKKKCPWWI